MKKIGQLLIRILLFTPLCISAVSGFVPVNAAEVPFASLEKIATQSLQEGIATLPSGNYLKAGAHQFQGLWSRDFAFGTRGLKHLGRFDVIRDHLTLVLGTLRGSDGMVPRYLDSSNTRERYLNGFFGRELPLSEPLYPNFEGGGDKGQATDSNALILLAALDYLAWSGDVAWWNQHQAQLIQAYRFYDDFLVDGLISQPEYADWQDSVWRKGKTFFCNLLYYTATERLRGYPGFGIESARVTALKTKMIQEFLDPKTGLYRTIVGMPQISLDGNLLAIDLGFHAPGTPEAAALYKNLTRHPLWAENPATRSVFPGFATYPDYPANWVQWNVKLAGMRNYHDSIYWSWLIGLAAKVAYEMGDRASGDSVLAQMQSMAERDGGIAEVYRHESPHARWMNLRYRAEMPFSWGSSLVLDAIGQSRL